MSPSILLRVAGVGLWIAASACATAETPTSAGPAGIDRADLDRSWGEHRTLGPHAELLADAASGDAPARASALQALGRMQTPQGIDVVVGALVAAEPEVRRAAARAAGQLGLSWQPLSAETTGRLERAVAAAAGSERDLASLTEELEALGRLGTLPELVPWVGDPRAAVRTAAFQAVGIAAYRAKGADPAPALEALTHASQDPDRQVRRAAVYALMRSKAAGARAGLVFGLRDADAVVRATSAHGLGDVAEPSDVPYLVERLDDPDLQVRAESARALGKLASRCKDAACPAAASAIKALDLLTPRYQPADPATAIPLLALTQEALPPGLATPLEKAEAAVASKPLSPNRALVACTLAAAADRLRADGALPLLASCGMEPGPRFTALQLRALSGGLGSADIKAKALLALRSESDSSRSAVDDALGELGVMAPGEADRLRSDLSSTDIRVAASAADAAVKVKLSDATPLLDPVRLRVDRPGWDDALSTVLGDMVEVKAPGVEAALQQYAGDDRPQVRAAALAGAEKLGLKVDRGTPSSRPLPPSLEQPTSAVTVVEQTPKGAIVYRLHPEVAPIAVANFVSLVRRGYFDHLVWHRMVPAFVVQGGDPLGDGSGGPGYTIPCEVDGLPYQRGTVGMALSGKDTGGSQFFITLLPQPHLDGRYTSFAEVESGMDVADRLLEGDDMGVFHAVP